LKLILNTYLPGQVPFSAQRRGVLALVLTILIDAVLSAVSLG